MRTSLDKWLKERFVLETHLFTVHLPPRVPSGVKVRKLKKKEDGKFNYRLVARSSKKTDRLVRLLNDNGVLFKAKILEGGFGLVRFFVGGKRSLVFFLFWLTMGLACLVGVVILFLTFKDHPVLVSGFQDIVTLVGDFFR